jgi:hypothetical protein
VRAVMIKLKSQMRKPMKMIKTENIDSNAGKEFIHHFQNYVKLKISNPMSHINKPNTNNNIPKNTNMEISSANAIKSFTMNINATKIVAITMV